VTHLRRVQDEFLKNLMHELGGPNPVNQRATVATREIAHGKIVLAAAAD
jgi:hypothetical protein